MLKPTKAELTKALQTTAKLLEDLKKWGLREPNSDFHEYCTGCNQSPYLGRHKPGCPVPRVQRTLNKIRKVLKDKE